MSSAFRWSALTKRVNEVATECGRDPSEITLIAVSKRQSFDSVLEVYEAGARHFGENTAKGFRERQMAFSEMGITDVCLHFIGALQTNKVKAVVPGAYAIHSLDRRRLLEAIVKRAPQSLIDVFIQVNLGDELQKSGVSSKEALGFAQAVAKEEFVRLRGLMVLPPRGESPELYFRELALLGEELKAMCFENNVQLSMGMSADFETAIRCGATHLRVGTGIFGPRL